MKESPQQRDRLRTACEKIINALDVMDATPQGQVMDSPQCAQAEIAIRDGCTEVVRTFQKW